jgi:hypothetical protein
LMCLFLICVSCGCGSETTPSGGGAGGDIGGTGGTGGSGGAGGISSTRTTTQDGGTTSSSSSDTCAVSACADVECGPILWDCNGDGIKDYVDCGGCAAPAACMGSNVPNQCGTRCASTLAYVAACGPGVEFACADASPGCGFAYKIVDGEVVYKVVGVNCPKAVATGGVVVRCCVPGCGGDC